VSESGAKATAGNALAGSAVAPGVAPEIAFRVPHVGGRGALLGLDLT
jgi:hypothetical protein